MVLKLDPLPRAALWKIRTGRCEEARMNVDQLNEAGPSQQISGQVQISGAHSSVAMGKQAINTITAISSLW